MAPRRPLSSPPLSSISRKLGDDWKALPDAAKAPFVALAAADAAAAAAQNEASGAAAAAAATKQAVKAAGGKKGKVAAVAAGAAAEKNGKVSTGSAFARFADDTRAVIASVNPGADAAAMAALLGAAWKGADASVRARYEAEAAATAAVAAAKAGDNAKKRARGASPDDDDAGDEVVPTSKRAAAAAADASDDEDDVAERLAVDWAAHPPVAVVGQNRGGFYLVARAGAPLSAYGLVDAAAAASARVGAGMCPLPAAMLDEYDASVAAFDAALAARVAGGGLNLEGLAAGDPLDACALLWHLRTGDGPLAPPPAVKGRANKRAADPMIRVPALALSRVVGRLLQVERARADKAEAALAAATAGEGVEK